MPPRWRLCPVVQMEEEEVTVNGEKVENASEEEESEEMESDEEERLQLAEGAVPRGSRGTFSQVEDEQESEDSGEEQGEEEDEEGEEEEEGTESDLVRPSAGARPQLPNVCLPFSNCVFCCVCLWKSTESSLKKRMKKEETKVDGAWPRPSRKRKRTIKAKGGRHAPHSLPQPPRRSSGNRFVLHGMEN